jgi:hypothetical protein
MNKGVFTQILIHPIDGKANGIACQNEYGTID